MSENSTGTHKKFQAGITAPLGSTWSTGFKTVFFKDINNSIN